MTVSHLIADAIAADRVRRFEPGDGSDFLKLRLLHVDHRSKCRKVAA